MWITGLMKTGCREDYVRLRNMLNVILTRPAFFLIVHRRTESVCYYAIKSQFDVLYFDM
jgi:hypothetical protein